MAEYFLELKFPFFLAVVGIGVLASGDPGAWMVGLALLVGGGVLAYRRYTAIQEAQQADIATRADRAQRLRDDE